MPGVGNGSPLGKRTAAVLVGVALVASGCTGNAAFAGNARWVSNGSGTPGAAAPSDAPTPSPSPSPTPTAGRTPKPPSAPLKSTRRSPLYQRPGAPPLNVMPAAVRCPPVVSLSPPC